MIEVNELRIGNLVTDSKTGKIVTVDGIQFTGRIVTHDESYDDWKRGIEPVGISLTPEILEKAGFENYKDYLCYIKKYNKQGELILFSTNTSVGMANNLEENCFYYGFNKVHHIIKSLHQLQNLYFALTNEELKINL